jgi:molybdopterin molybdotransferase
MATLTFEEARSAVLSQVPIAKPGSEGVWLPEAIGRVLAQDVLADRDMPPMARSLRDGYAVRSQDLLDSAETTLRVVGEVKAGKMPERFLRKGEAFSIMTGAILPEGADQVVMKEHSLRDGELLRVGRGAQPREWISEAGSMAKQGSVVAAAGTLIDASTVAMLASVGVTQPQVYSRPVVRILATGDEVIDIARKPDPTQVRNSNAWALAADVRQFGGNPEILPIAPDEERATRELIEYGLEADLLLISGGVSAGDYDFVEAALEQLGALFYFDRVLIQPGQPTVFGQARSKYFFGLPGNPLSTWVTFRLFGLAALARLAGLAAPRPLFSRASLAKPFRHKQGLTRFLPGLEHADGTVEVLPWQGSGDIPALTRANVILVFAAERESWEAGDSVGVMSK